MTDTEHKSRKISTGTRMVLVYIFLGAIILVTGLIVVPKIARQIPPIPAPSDASPK